MSNNKEAGEVPTSGSYVVGNCKPPKHCQFQKGTSGNPKGRPKGSKNASTFVNDMFHQIITVTVNGKPKKMKVIEALLAKLISAAMSGDPKAMKLALDTYLKGISDPTILGLTGGQTSFELTADDYEVIAKNKLLDGVN
jgi:hypothetical protein